MIRIIQPNGLEISYAYDSAHRLVGIQDNLGNGIYYTLDAMGNHLKEEVRDRSGALTRVLEGEYDQISRLQLAVGGENQLTRYRYDANGNKIGQTDPRNTGNSRSAARSMDPAATDNSTISIYDALDRIIQSTHIRTHGNSGDDITTSYFYNALGQLEIVTDPNGLQTHYSYNALGDLLQKQSPDTGITGYQYDNAGNLISRTDARGITVRYRYDALNRLVLADYPEDMLDVHYSYDEGPNGIGRLITMQDGTSITHYQYDIRGQLTEVQQILEETTSLIQSQYEIDGNISDLTYPSGHKVHYQRDLAGQITGIHADIQGQTYTLAEDFVWQSDGHLIQLRYGNGLLHQAQFDLSGRLRAENTEELRTQSYDYDLSDNLELLKDELDMVHTQSFAYDALDRLVYEEGSYGQRTFDYDETDNRIQQITTEPGAVSQVQNYIYGLDNHHLVQIEPQSVREYDAWATRCPLMMGSRRTIIILWEGWTSST